ncbi:hypothetical protein ABPG72_016724 [Tetrahymena utriculariae]
MGCTSAKGINDKQKCQQQLEYILQQYVSLELYIQNQRQNVFNYLSHNGDSLLHLETEKDRNVMINVCQDIANFRKYRKVNKYKYEVTIPKFFKQIKQCYHKMKIIDEIHQDFFQQNELIKISNEGQKFLKKNEIMFTHIQDLKLKINGYLQFNKDFSEEENKQHTLLSEIKNQPTSASELDLIDLKTK